MLDLPKFFVIIKVRVEKRFTERSSRSRDCGRNISGVTGRSVSLVVKRPYVRRRTVKMVLDRGVSNGRVSSMSYLYVNFLV